MHSRNPEGFQSVVNPKNRWCRAVARVSEAIPGNAASRVPDVASLIRATGLRASRRLRRYRIEFDSSGKTGAVWMMAPLEAGGSPAAERHAEDTKKKTEDLPDLARLLRPGDRRALDEGGAGRLGRKVESVSSGRREGDRRSRHRRGHHGEAGRGAQASGRIGRRVHRAFRVADRSR